MLVQGMHRIASLIELPHIPRIAGRTAALLAQLAKPLFEQSEACIPMIREFLLQLHSQTNMVSIECLEMPLDAIYPA
ncbi:hypothetical protein D7V88_12855 [Corallococcus terminator]|uniref:Uncharacterized protein n=1 Tax=Corallococcus terminator TaxID=2316733 RepID=A0A3A8J0Q1_9BACT|nr:hypothetical protein D7V88_12855 [Corallococcus terminator]